MRKLNVLGTIPAVSKVTESAVTLKGVIVVNYERAGASPNRKSVLVERKAEVTWRMRTYG